MPQKVNIATYCVFTGVATERANTQSPSQLHNRHGGKET